jgi:hypothetical protein
MNNKTKMTQYYVYGQDQKYPLADLVDPIVSGFLIISQEEVVTLLNAKDYQIAKLKEDNDELAAANEAHLGVMLEAHKLAQKHSPYIAQKLHLMIGWAPVDLLAIRDLEREAKGVEDATDISKIPYGRNGFGFQSYMCSRNSLLDYRDKLLNKIKALKESKT